ncbi:MAG: NFACT RNA binding domain-containing protein [Planctomycetota bacterium]
MDPGHRRVGLQRRGALSARHVGELVDEIGPLLRGWRVRDVQPLPPRDLLIAFEPPTGGSDEAPADAPPVRRLRLSADPGAARLHLVRARVRSHRGPVGPFFRRLDTELPGAEFVELRQLAADRLVRLALRSDGKKELALVLELVGRHSNLVLIDADERVRDVLVPPPAKAGAEPRLRAGERWNPPLGQAPSDPGPALAEAFSLAEDAADEPATDAPLSRRVELTLGVQAEAIYDAALRKDLTQRLKRKRKTAERTLAGLTERRAAAAESERVRQDGELLKAAQGSFKRGQREIELDDWFSPDGAKRRLELDPKLTPNENVERLFRRYRKLVRAAENLEADESRAQGALEALEALLADAQDPAVEPEELERRAIDGGQLSPRQEAGPRRPKKRAAPRVPYRTYQTASGRDVLVGKSARDNDTLSLKVARGSDLWLHTADAPGSHVVLRAERGVEPDPEDVLDAAHLALHFSPLKGARKADIHVARCKEVKKPKGAPAGLVILSGGRVLRLRVEEDRLRRLLDARR